MSPRSKNKCNWLLAALPVVRTFVFALSFIAVLIVAPGASAQDKARDKNKDQARASAEPSYKGYFVQQTSPSQGSVTIYLTPKHWQIKSAVFTIIVDEEKDTIIAYTRQTNKYIKDSLEVGKRRFAGFNHGGDFTWFKSKTIDNTPWQGHKGITLERSGKRSDLKVANDVIITERQLSLPDIAVSKTFAFVAFALFSQDYDRGLVVDVKRMAHSANPRYCTTRPVDALDTRQLKERVFHPYDFVLPGGLTRVKTEIDMFSNEQMDMPAELPIDDNVTKLRKRAEQLHVKTSK